MECQVDFHKYFLFAFALFNYALLFTLPLETHLETKISHSPCENCVLYCRVGCSLPKPQSCLHLNPTKSQNTSSLPTLESCLIFWGDSFQSTTYTPLPLLPFSLQERKGQQTSTDWFILWRQTSFIQSTERGRHPKCGLNACPLTFQWLLRSQRVHFRWPGSAHSRKATKWRSISVSGTALNDVKTNPFWQECPFFSTTYLLQSRFTFYLTLFLKRMETEVLWKLLFRGNCH